MFYYINDILNFYRQVSQTSRTIDKYKIHKEEINNLYNLVFKIINYNLRKFNSRK